jgi:VWFA-related protein
MTGLVLAAAIGAAAVSAAATRTVIVSVEDPQGRLIPNLHPENFAVYENGERQRDVAVKVAHEPITLGVLLEGGGRYQAVNKILSTEIPYLIRPLGDALIPADKVGTFAYTDTLRTLADFSQAHTALDVVVTGIPAPGFSEANLFDAVAALLERLRPFDGRKAVLLVSTGIDTFSHTTLEDVVASAQRSATPVYAIGLAGVVQRTLVGATGPVTKINWEQAKERLTTLARSSGGRAYMRDTEIDVPAVYDDMMERLRVRYALTYSMSRSDGSATNVRVELIDPKTGGPLRVKDASGKPIVAKVIVNRDRNAPP